MTSEVTYESTPDLWFHTTCQEVWNTGEHREGRNGKTRSLFGESVEFSLAEGFPILTCKSMNFKATVGETLAFLAGADNDSQFREMGCNFWTANANANYWLRNPNHSGVPGDLGRIYGVQWRDWRYAGPNFSGTQTLDQLAKLLSGLRRDPYGRRHIVTAWNPGELAQMALPPCHAFFQVYCHSDGGLSLQMYQRSADLFLGVPYNITSYALITHILAHMTGRYPKKLKLVFGDLHLYEAHELEDQALTALENALVNDGHSYTLPQLNISDVLNPTSDFSLSNMEEWAQLSTFSLTGYKSGPAIKARMLA